MELWRLVAEVVTLVAGGTLVLYLMARVRDRGRGATDRDVLRTGATWTPVLLGLMLVQLVLPPIAVWPIVAALTLVTLTLVLTDG